MPDTESKRPSPDSRSAIFVASSIDERSPSQVLPRWRRRVRVQRLESQRKDRSASPRASAADDHTSLAAVPTRWAGSDRRQSRLHPSVQRKRDGRNRSRPAPSPRLAGPARHSSARRDQASACQLRRRRSGRSAAARRRLRLNAPAAAIEDRSRWRRWRRPILRRRTAAVGLRRGLRHD